nr:MAG TPA: hypothetical protein [Caudoviricetes sp.]
MILKFGTHWKTLQVFINGNSVRFQKFITTQKPINRDIQNICYLNKKRIRRRTVSTFVTLIRAERYIQ